MSLLAYIAPWVLVSVAVGIAVGVLLGRGRNKGSGPEQASTEERALLKILAELLAVAEQMASNVEHHSTKIQENAQQDDRLHVTGEMETIKEALLYHMTALLASNQQMQEDLVCTRYRLEEQAQELINYTDSIYLQFGAQEKVYGLETQRVEEIQETQPAPDGKYS